MLLVEKRTSANSESDGALTVGQVTRGGLQVGIIEMEVSRTVILLSLWLRWIEAEDTHLHRKEKYHCTADLQFDWFGLDKTSK